MSHLSSALKKYYKNNGKRVVFDNGFNTAKMAMQMWEMLECSQVDGSVMSRVLSGARLFTPTQLDVFCRVLKLSKSEVDELQSALMQDYMSRDKFRSQISGFTKKINDYTHDLLDMCGELLADGKYHELNNTAAIILKHIGEPIYTENIEKISAAQLDQLVLALFYRGISCGMTNIRDAQVESSVVVEKLRSISNFTTSPHHRATFHLLSANTQYIRAEYKQLGESAQCAAHHLALGHTARAIENSDLNNPIALFSYRQMIIALSRLHKKLELVALYESLYSQMDTISHKQDIYALRLYRSAFNEMEKLDISINPKHQEAVRRRFGNILEKTVLYQISDIRTQIYSRAMRSTRIKDKSLIALIDKGLELSSMHKYYRHYNSIRRYRAILKH